MTKRNVAFNDTLLHAGFKSVFVCNMRPNFRYHLATQMGAATCDLKMAQHYDQVTIPVSEVHTIAISSALYTMSVLHLLQASFQAALAQVISSIRSGIGPSLHRRPQYSDHAIARMVRTDSS